MGRRPNAKGLRRVEIRVSEVLAAARREREWNPNGVNAPALGVLLHRKVYRRWQQVNRQLHPAPSIERIRGEKPPENGRGIEDWTRFRGYVLRFREDEGMFSAWNSVRADYYSHSAGTTWDGIRRETFCSFVDALLGAARRLEEGFDPTWGQEETLARYRITLVDDITERGGRWGARPKRKRAR